MTQENKIEDRGQSESNRPTDFCETGNQMKRKRNMGWKNGSSRIKGRKEVSQDEYRKRKERRSKMKEKKKEQHEKSGGVEDLVTDWKDKEQQTEEHRGRHRRGCNIE